MYGFACVFASREDLHLLKNFQRKVVRWITVNKTKSYRSQLKILNILPLPLFLQLNGMLLFSKITSEEMGTSISLTERPKIRGRRSEIFKLWKTRTEIGRSEFVFRNCRLVSRLDDYIDFMNPQGLKNRLPKLMWIFLMKGTQNQTCALGSSHATAPRAATSGHYFKMTTGALSPAAKANNNNEFPTTTTTLL